MASTSMPGARSESNDPFHSIIPDCNEANVRMSDRRYQQLELTHKSDRGVCGAMEFR
jgi:hypothetical protein